MKTGELKLVSFFVIKEDLLVEGKTAIQIVRERGGYVKTLQSGGIPHRKAFWDLVEFHPELAGNPTEAEKLYDAEAEDFLKKITDLNL